MLEALPRQWSTKMATSCAQTGGLLRHKRKAAPKSIILPDRQFLISPERRTWRACFRETITSKGSRDSGLVLSDHEELLSPCDSGFHSSSRLSKAGSKPNHSPWAWPFEHQTDCTTNRPSTPKSPAFGRQGFGSPATRPFSPQPKTTHSHNRWTSGSKYREHKIREQMPVEDLVVKLCAHIQTSLHLTEATGRSKSSSRSRRSSMRTSSSGAASSNTSLNSVNSIAKRGRDADDGEDEFSEEGDRKGKKIRDQSPSKPTLPNKLFACPFAKHEPLRYSHQNMVEMDYRNCSTGYWPTIARLKQHLYRTHDRSQLCCPRCWQSFTNAGPYQKHIEVLKCELREMPEEKMNSEKYNLVKERSHGDPIELWYKIFETLFPTAERPYSPYAELVIGADMRNLLQDVEQKLPSLVTSIVTDRIQNQSLENISVEEMLDSVLEDCLSEALRTLRNNLAESTGTEHILQASQSSILETQAHKATTVVDTALYSVAESSRPRPRRPTNMLARLPTVESITSELTVTALNVHNISDYSIRFHGTAQPSDPELFDPDNELCDQLYDYRNEWDSQLWHETKPAQYHQPGAIPIDMQLHQPRFDEPGRPEFPFPSPDPTSSASSMHYEESNMAMSMNDLSVSAGASSYGGNEGAHHLHDHGQQYPEGDPGLYQVPTQQFGYDSRFSMEEFNSHSDVTGMHLFFQ